MGRNAEAAVFAILATMIAVPAIVIFSWLAIGPQPSGNHLHLAVVLSIAAAASAFVSARLLLARSRLSTWRAGLKLGLSAAFLFYLFWLLVFAVVPALVGAPESWMAAISFLLRAGWQVIGMSRALPLVVGVVAGVVYASMKQQILRRSAAGL